MSEKCKCNFGRVIKRIFGNRVVPKKNPNRLKLDMIRQYCDYIEEHLDNVDKAWNILKNVLREQNVIYDDFLFFTIVGMIENHDVSKMSDEEFLPYAEWFFGSYGVNYDPVDDDVFEDEHKEVKSAFDAAWEHHKENNPHHWQKWTKATERFPNESACHVVCMVADWMAMGMKFGDTAEQYYEREKDKMELPGWAVEFLQQIFVELRKNRPTR